MVRLIRAVLSREDTGVKEGGDGGAGVGENFGGCNINPGPENKVSLSFA
jgi:hypothetical protein